MNLFVEIPKYTVLLALVVFMLLGLESPVARGMLVIIFIAIVFCIGSCLEYMKRPECTAIISLLVLNTVYYILGDISRHFGFYSNILLCLGIFFFSYYMSLNRRLKEWQIVAVFVLLLIATSYRFFQERAELMDYYDEVNKTMNLSYAFVIFTPYLFYVKNKFLTIILVLFCLFMVLNGAKRGAIFIFFISIAYYLYYEYIVQKGKIKIKYMVIACAFILAALFYVEYAFENNVYLQARLDETLEGNTNGRRYIYRTIINKWTSEDNLLNFIFGYGFCSSMDIAGNRAHNDWLELIASSGLLGLLVCILYYVKLLKAKKAVLPIVDRRAFSLLLLILFLKSMFSMSYCSVENMPIFLLLGFIIGRNRKCFSVNSQERQLSHIIIR